MVGGVTVADDGRAAPRSPWPGLSADPRPLAWFDSLAVRVVPAGGGADALARVSATRTLPGARRARAVFGYTSGDGGVEETTLLAERGDADRGLRAEVAAGNRGAFGSLGDAGRHLWGLSGRTVRGPHRFEAAYVQRGMAQQLTSLGQSEFGKGEAGQLGWRWSAGVRHAAAKLERGYDGRESYGGLMAYSRRDAAENRVTVTAGTRVDSTLLDATLRWNRARVRRAYADAFDRRAEEAWAALRAQRPLGGGALDATLGLGHHDRTGGWQLAPAAVYRFSAVGTRSSASVARLVAPVWADRAPGVDAFLQRTWAGGLDVAAGEGVLQARLAFAGGVTRDRALVSRSPITEAWLRAGVSRERERAPFALTTAAVRLAGRRLDAEVEGFALVQRDGERSPDPAHGFRAHAGLRARLFEGDLLVLLRAELAGEGPRSVDGDPALRLPGYVTSGATVALRLADATVTVRARNLEAERRREPWIDPVTGAPALGGGREIRFALSWALAD